MEAYDKKLLPLYFWRELEEKGSASFYIEAPKTLLYDKNGKQRPEYWTTIVEEPDFPRPAYTRSFLNERGRKAQEQYRKNMYVPGYWTAQYGDGSITCFKSISDLENLLVTHHTPFLGIVNPEGKRCRITAVPYE